ncbi:cilia- and flagella-associated protein 45-like isoform X1 [Sycon ciliatum]|uniref:cilia- and flagella-associated protein 45-like isoform X1 n=1 Tax=Sycon ciliatum TaxID=27933 RepID=UPI0031F5F77D
MPSFIALANKYFQPDIQTLDQHALGLGSQKAARFNEVHSVAELARSVSTSTRGSGASGAAANPKKTNTSRYRRLAGKSSVDESLFTGGQASKKKTTMRSRNIEAEKRELQGLATLPAKPKQETINLVTKDLIRTLRVPQKDPSGQSVILPMSEFDRIKQRATAPSIAQRKTLVAEQKELEAGLQEASSMRRQEMRAYEETRKRNAKPSDLEEEAYARAQHLQEKAEASTIEQEDEIKNLNEILLEAKCNAIRDLQLEEKKELAACFEDEDKRLDTMMEAERKQRIEEHEMKENKQRLQRLEGATVLRTQIEKQEQHRLLNEEKKDQETQQMIKYLQHLQEEDMDAMRVKKEKQAALMVEVGKANEEIKRQKLVKREQEKQEELQVAKYLREKAEREEALAKEAERQRIAKEKEIARLRSLQERAKDEQAEKDALRAKRDQENAEREWRRKERERVAKETSMHEHLRQARVDQVHHKEHYMAVQAARDRQVFDTMVHEQRKALEEEKQTEQRQAAARYKNASVVRKQITDKEAQQVEQRQDFFQEGRRLDKEAQERRERLHAIKMKKLEALKDIGIPDKYCAQVSRHIHAPPPSFTMSKKV